MAKLFKKLSGDMNKLVKERLSKKFDVVVEEIKEVIIAAYDDQLVDVVVDRKSKTNPNLYREEFIERVNEFEYVEKLGESLSIKVPDMETFDFSGRLKVIKTITEGMAGIYVEVNEEDYKAVFGKRPLNQDQLDEYVLVRYTSKIRKAEMDLGKKFVRCPFSNTPPSRIFEEGERFVDENMSRWIEEALEEAQKEFVTKYRGAKL
jgi:hypothetical protein